MFRDITIKIESNNGINKQDNKKLNKYILELRQQYETDIFQEVSLKSKSFLTVGFFSAPQFL